MKILYGVCGEGFGHSSRALTLGEHLKKEGHEILIITYGQAYKVLKDKFKCVKVSGLHLIFRKSILSKRKTFHHNLKNFPKNIWHWKKFYKIMRDFNPDVCISDMEPIVPILSYWSKKTLICFDNQHRLTNLRISVPKKYYSDYLRAKLVTESFVGKADYFVVSSFGKSKIKTKNTTIVPPIIRSAVIDAKENSRYKNKILVYLTKKDSRIIKILKTLPENFVLYGYNKLKKSDNIEFKTRETFLEDLKDCKAVIASAGFSLMGEAIYLRKPYFALPLKGQFEQTLNALFLKQAKFGEYSEDLKSEEVITFLKKLESYKKNLRRYNPDYNLLFKTFDKILKSI